MPITAVIGAGGPVGTLCVQQLLDAGNVVRAIVRSPEKFERSGIKADKLEVTAGDVTTTASIRAALQGVDSCIFAAAGATYFGAHAVENKGVSNVATAASEAGTHVVLVSASLVTPKNWYHPVRILLNNVIRYNMIKEKLAGERALRDSGTPYTIVRPGRFAKGPAGQHKIRADQQDNTGQGSISMADVAAVCVAATSNPKARNVTLEIKNDAKTRAEAGDLATLFDGLKPGIHDTI